LEKQIAAKDLEMAGDQKYEKSKAMKCTKKLQREREGQSNGPSGHQGEGQ